MTAKPDASSADLATATGAVGAAGIAAFAAFGVAGQPFGTINDVCGAATGVLSAALAWRLRKRIGTPVAALAGVGAATTVAGNYLVVSQSTGWLLAGWVSAVGFGLIGPAIAAAALSDLRDGATSPAVAKLGIATGVLAASGVIGILPAAMRVDDFANAPAWTYAAFVGWLGTAGYPLWALLASQQWRRQLEQSLSEESAV